MARPPDGAIMRPHAAQAQRAWSKLDDSRRSVKLTDQIDRSRTAPINARGRGFGEAPAPFRRGGVTEVQASVAKAHFSQLLDAVERGQTIVILRHGKPVARIVPDDQARMERQRMALENIDKLGREIRKRNGPISIEEIISSIHEGHRY
ncbi:MAG: type II toxin-antitoxin system Phd/YefM family antitoxin [Stellaceae bacterium]